MSIPALISAALIAAGEYEAVTLLFRFGPGLQSTRDTRWLRRWTGRLYIHHGYVGAVALPTFLLAPVPPLIADVGVVVAGAPEARSSE